VFILNANIITLQSAEFFTVKVESAATDSDSEFSITPAPTVSDMPATVSLYPKMVKYAKLLVEPANEMVDVSGT
jgi:hypothetical protein